MKFICINWEETPLKNTFENRIMNQQVRKGEELNNTNLKQFLKTHELILNISSDLFVSQFPNGFSNLTYLLTYEDKEFVLRRPPQGAIKRGHDMGREYKVLSKLPEVFKKAPKALVFTNNKEIIGAPFYLMEKVEGIILNVQEAKKRKIKPDEFRIIANSWLETFIELHQVDYQSIGLDDLGRPAGYVERQITNWGKQYLKASTQEVPEAFKIMDWMQNKQPLQYSHCLIHNDYKYDNIVFKDDSWLNVCAVLDWEMCTLGDPLMDLGTSLAYWTMSSDGQLVTAGIPSPTVLEGNPSRTEIVQQYALKSDTQIDNLVFYYVYGLFKIAVIAQQIYYRYHQGLTTDHRFATLDKSSEFLCRMAWQAIQKNRVDDLF